MSNSIKPVRVSGELYWSKWMGEFNTKFNEANNKYECTVGQLSDKAVAALTELGIKVKHKDTMGHYIVAKSKYKFDPKDENGNPIEVEDIGNGTKCTAVISSYEHRMSKAHGNAPSLKLLVITDLKRYIPEDKAEEEEDLVL